jgi:hypothetical protein
MDHLYLPMLSRQLLEAEKVNQEKQHEYQSLLQNFVKSDVEQVDKWKSDAFKWQQECQQLVLKLDQEASFYIKKINEI